MKNPLTDRTWDWMPQEEYESHWCMNAFRADNTKQYCPRCQLRKLALFHGLFLDSEYNTYFTAVLCADCIYELKNLYMLCDKPVGDVKYDLERRGFVKDKDAKDKHRPIA